MFTPTTKLRRAAAAAVMSAAVVGLGAGAANAAGWPPLQEGAYLYSGPNGSGAVTEVDLRDVGTCHNLAEPAASIQIASGSTSVVLYSGSGCTATWPWASGTLAQTNLPWAMQSYRVVMQ
ncbi:hypothetical protein ACH4A8_28965 [Streptomyces vietnamensis]|uniref:hypothetical protein n=1 Tax=Streptomyces vietnamensis TaxID=362257 RepID=UPI0037AAB326